MKLNIFEPLISKIGFTTIKEIQKSPTVIMSTHNNDTNYLLLSKGCYKSSNTIERSATPKPSITKKIIFIDDIFIDEIICEYRYMVTPFGIENAPHSLQIKLRKNDEIIAAQKWQHIHTTNLLHQVYHQMEKISQLYHQIQKHLWPVRIGRISHHVQHIPHLATKLIIVLDQPTTNSSSFDHQLQSNNFKITNQK